MGTVLANSSVEQKMEFIEEETKNYFNNWNTEQYEGWTCNEKSEVCQEYIRDDLGFPCILVYGHSQEFTAHKWVLVYLEDSWYEFETTCFSFQDNERFRSDMFAQVFYREDVE